MPVNPIHAERVIDILQDGEFTPQEIAAWVQMPNSAFGGRTPLDALEEGNVGAAVNMANAVVNRQVKPASLGKDGEPAKVKTR